MKHETDCAENYDERTRLSRRIVARPLQVLLVFLGFFVALDCSIPVIADTGSGVLDDLLSVEAEHPDLCNGLLDADSTRARIQELTSAARQQFASRPSNDGPRERAESAIRTLNRIVLGHAGIQPSPDLHDPCNLFLSSVLAQKQGYCVGVAGVYLVLAEELDLPIQAVATPSHMFLRYTDGEVSINIDPSSQGAALPDQQYISQHRIAEKSIRKGVFLKPLTAEQFLAQVHNNLGVVYSERKDYSAAAREFESALGLDSRLPSAWYNQGKMLAELEDFRGAVRSFSKALRLHPNDTWALNNRGMAYMALEKATEAKGDLEAALRIDPAFEQAKHNLVQLERQ